MAFTLTLWNCSSDPRELKKDLKGDIPVYDVKPTGIVDLMSPSFELNYKPEYTTKNYCSVGAPFNRSYFITDMKVDIGKKIIISCAVDVLQTYQSGISQINANIVRQENLAEPYLPDSEYKIRTGFQNYTELFQGGEVSFAGGDAQYSYVLSWVGGDYTGQYIKLPINIQPADWTTSWADYYVFDGTDYVSVGIPYGFTVAPDYQTVYQDYNGVWRML